MPPTAITISARCLDRLNECCRKMAGRSLDSFNVITLISLTVARLNDIGRDRPTAI